MSQQQHTQEPWYASKEDGNWRVMAADENGGYTLADMHCDDPAANVRRIVACVNACAGIPTDMISHVVAFGLHGHSKISEERDEWKRRTEFSFQIRDELKAQRDTMLAALESISKITYDAGFNIGGPLEHCPGNIGHDEAKRLLSLACEYLKDTSKAAQRAIASVKEQA